MDRARAKPSLDVTSGGRTAVPVYTLYIYIYTRVVLHSSRVCAHGLHIAFFTASFFGAFTARYVDSGLVRVYIGIGPGLFIIAPAAPKTSSLLLGARREREGSFTRLFGGFFASATRAFDDVVEL